MTSDIESKEDMVMIVVRIPLSMRRKLKVIAAYNNSSMNDKAKIYIEKGIKQEENIMENIEAK